MREVHAVERVEDLAADAPGEEVLPHGIRERDEWRCLSREAIREPADGEVASPPGQPVRGGHPGPEIA
jgi:hypothetical protein